MQTTRTACTAISLRGFARRAIVVGFSVIALAATALDASPAWAQKGNKDAVEEPVKGYTMPYFLSGVAVLMVVVPLCLPSLRPVETPKEEED
jgi:hypothetical protein